ncbi:MAG TPA: hypothetical protein VHB53_00450 [Solirubrobacterales bacterium]|nr:hypothetical protein [Solirubrobacterales bacterium]
MEPRCPRCTDSHLKRLDEDVFLCLDCGARFPRDQALVRVAEAERLADERAACTCDEKRGCPQCFRRAEELVGQLVRDAFGREWRVVGAGERDRFPTIYGEVFWDVPDQVTVIGR